MAYAQDTSLEEILWRSPPHVQMMGGFLHSNNILFYFAESPFFDATSNNASLAIQANYNEAFRQFIETREAFEGRLRTMQGLEFMVAYDPLQAAAQANGASFSREPSNIWVIRKQNRRKRAGMDDEVQVLSTYFVVGDCIYMAPSVASVVGNRILSAVTSLTKLLKTASTLPTFTPSYGHTYMPPVPRTSDLTHGGPSAQLSKESTPMPDADTSHIHNKAPIVGAHVSSSSSTYQDTRNLAEAFSLLGRYGDEYMDENPLAGEPGSFILSKSGETGAAAAAGTAATAKSGTTAATTAITATNPAAPSGTSRAATPNVKPDASFGSTKSSDKGSPSSGAEESKLKRRRSKMAS